MSEDKVNHPKHYTSHPSGVECIEITEHYNFTVGNAIKYLWRCGLKQEEGMDPAEKQIQDLKKAIWYINREIKNLEEGVYNGKDKQKQNEGVAQGITGQSSGSNTKVPHATVAVKRSIETAPEVVYPSWNHPGVTCCEKFSIATAADNINHSNFSFRYPEDSYGKVTLGYGK